MMVKTEFGLQPTIRMVMDALAEAPGAMSPNAIGKALGAVIVGVQCGPDTCVSVNPLICVVYAGPTTPFVAVIVTVRVLPVPGFMAAENFNP